MISTSKLLLTTPKVAFFYDWINQWGGAEKVLLDMMEVYPGADLFTIVYDPHKTEWLPKNTRIIPSKLNKLPFSKNNPILYTPFYDLALEQFDFSKYDIVISTTSTIGHCLLTQPKTLFICYFHNINRYLYQQNSRYPILSPLLKAYRRIDKIYSRRPDYIMCNSKNVSNRILASYQLSSKIINPGVELSFFKPSPSPSPPKDYYLIVSRLVPHKKVELAIKACSKLHLNLKIIGVGREWDHLNQIASKLKPNNIEFLGNVSRDTLLDLYQHCQAFIAPQEEDFGISPIEAQACGRPVIAFKKGGCIETIIDNKTGVFFSHQSTKSLINALKKFPKLSFNQDDCIQNAKQFSKENFMLNFSQSVNRLWQKHRNTSL
jgi:glycosyltransferase involved in cell wall biosynthesis